MNETIRISKNEDLYGRVEQMSDDEQNILLNILNKFIERKEEEK
ncbi:hypothetical protein [Bacillus wiedmannii]|nr:hypothetical protein [Bacillus wiedmannii]